MKFEWPFVPRAQHEAVLADRERIRGERNQFAQDRDAFKRAAETASEKYNDVCIVNECLTEDLTKARARLTEYSGRRTVPEVLEEHDTHRKALADALGEQKRHLNWDQLITEVVRLNKAAAEWMADVERLTGQLAASEERARLAVQGLRPEEWESRPVDGARRHRADAPGEELRRALDQCRALAQQLDILQAAHVADTRELHDLRQGGAS